MRNDTEAEDVYSAWNPGIQSVVPCDLRHLSTIFGSENVVTTFSAAVELHAWTGLSYSELVVFRPQRLALHELLIRVTADFVVPDGSRIGDLGINFREMASLLYRRHVDPQMGQILAAYSRARAELQTVVDNAFDTLVAPPSRRGPATSLIARMLAAIGVRGDVPSESPPCTDRDWGPIEIAACNRLAESADTAAQRLGYRALSRVLSGLFTVHGCAWGNRQLITSLATDMASNDYGSDAIGRTLAPWLLRAAQIEGFDLLPSQDEPVIINTKGASASGKSSLRPLHKKLAGDIGVAWRDFALISPDIWRKQLLDYGSLGAAYKYAGAFTADELQIVDQKLDRYMAEKNQRGRVSHLLIDRFRFDSFAPDSNEAGSNLLTRFGQTAYLFFMITPPETLVERAWSRGLKVGRYKAVDDVLAHAVEAYSGFPDVFFTWVRRGDKRVRFEFLDNTVPFGERPRTVAFGDNDRINILDVTGLLDVERFSRVNVDAPSAAALYRDADALSAQHNTGFLSRCINDFRRVSFARQATGRIYLELVAGVTAFVDAEELRAACADADTSAAIALAQGSATATAGVCTAPVCTAPVCTAPVYLRVEGDELGPTLGQWAGYPRKSQ